MEENLFQLSRAISARAYPVLIQGETSTGKTSLISYLAKASANHLIRINNHEHTDLQEYIGSYIPKSDGTLVFSHGALVKETILKFSIHFKMKFVRKTQDVQFLNLIM